MCALLYLSSLFLSPIALCFDFNFVLKPRVFLKKGSLQAEILLPDLLYFIIFAISVLGDTSMDNSMTSLSVVFIEIM